MNTVGDSGVREVSIASRLDRHEAIICALKAIKMFQQAGYRIKVEYYMYKRLRKIFGKIDAGRPTLIEGLGKTDLLVVIGGDGTLLRLLHYIDVPVRVIGVRVGRRGFLMNFECSEEDLNNIISGKYSFLYMPRLRVERVYSPPAINEVAIIAARGKTIALNVSIDCDTREGHRTGFRGDGLIISTMIGSFAYNLSAGGPLLQCEECIVVTPLNPIPGDANPLVFRNSCDVRVRILEGYRAPWLVVDGQYTVTLPIGSEIVVKSRDGVWVAIKKPYNSRHDA